MNKIKVAFVKFGGLASGGTEKYLQTIAAHLPRDRFEVDYYYCDSAPYIGSDYKHLDTDPARLNYMLNKNVNLVKFKVGAKDVTRPTHDWVDTNFWEVFKEGEYDIIQTGRSGHSEYPFNLIKSTTIVDSLHQPGMVDNQPNIAATLHVSEWNKEAWVKAGGKSWQAHVVYVPIELPDTLPFIDFREKLNFKDKFMYGLHQREDDGIYSPWPLQAYKEVEDEATAFVLLGGSKLYSLQAQSLNLKNFAQLPSTGDMGYICKFLECLDVYVHGRADGESNSQSIAEAMAFGKPIVSHYGRTANGHVETIGTAGIVHGHFDSYAAELINLRNNEEYREFRSINARNIFKEKYNLNAIISQVSKIYEDVYQKNKTIKSEDNWLQEWLQC